MAYSYIRNNRCRACAHPNSDMIASMDKDLLNEVSLDDVQAAYAGHFTKKSEPLTLAVLYLHRKHLRRSVPSALLEIPDLSGGNTVGDNNVEKVDSKRGEGFSTYLGTVIKNKEALDVIVASTLEDLNGSDEILENAVGPKNKAMLLSIRDRIRQSLASYIELSKSLVTPEIGVTISGEQGDRVTELLVLVRQAFEETVPDESVREQFFSALAVHIRKSQVLKDIFLKEKQDAKEAKVAN